MGFNSGFKGLIKVSLPSPERYLLANSKRGFTDGYDIDPRFPTQRTPRISGKFLKISISLKSTGYEVNLHILITFRHLIKDVGNHDLKRHSNYTPSTHFHTGLLFWRHIFTKRIVRVSLLTLFQLWTLNFVEWEKIHYHGFVTLKSPLSPRPKKNEWISKGKLSPVISNYSLRTLFLHDNHSVFKLWNASGNALVKEKPTDLKATPPYFFLSSKDL